MMMTDTDRARVQQIVVGHVLGTYQTYCQMSKYGAKRREPMLTVDYLREEVVFHKDGTDWRFGDGFYSGPEASAIITSVLKDAVAQGLLGRSLGLNMDGREAYAYEPPHWCGV